MEIQIINTIESFEGPKRFYVPGLKFQCKCPRCDVLIIKDFSKEYFHQPLIGPNAKCIEYFYCENCHKEIKLLLNIDISINLIEAKEI